MHIAPSHIDTYLQELNGIVIQPHFEGRLEQDGVDLDSGSDFGILEKQQSTQAHTSMTTSHTITKEHSLTKMDHPR